MKPPESPELIPHENSDSKLASVTNMLLEYLMTDEIALGDRLPSERQMCEILGISRSALRESLKCLELLGLLESRAGSGTYLIGTTSKLLPKVIEWGTLLGERSERELIETRTFLEIEIAGLAAQNRSESELIEIRNQLEMMRKNSDNFLRYAEHDAKFHRAIAVASHNTVMLDLHDSIRALLQSWAVKVIKGFGRTDFSIAVHEPIVNAIEHGDVNAARAAMTLHMSNALRHLKEVDSESK